MTPKTLNKQEVFILNQEELELLIASVLEVHSFEIDQIEEVAIFCEIPFPEYISETTGKVIPVIRGDCEEVFFDLSNLKRNGKCTQQDLISILRELWRLAEIETGKYLILF